MKFMRKSLLVFGLIIMLSMVVPQGAFAQHTFYIEVPKEGRIYVFNDMKVYRDWLESGEIEKSITRPGDGPNGETLIFDSEAALHLYRFRHDLPGEVIVRPEEKKPKMSFNWKDGKTTWETDNASLTLSNRGQFRYTWEDPEGDDNERGSFRVRRFKTKLDGWIYTKKLTYELQLNWPDTTNALEDANLNYDFTGSKSVMIKGGQFKVPFGRQELTSSGNLQFVDRSVVSNEFAKGRDIGVQIWGLALNEKIDWRVGVFNGAGRNRTANDNGEYQMNARVTFQPLGDVKYSEVDFESTDRPLFAIAAQYETNQFVQTPSSPALPFETDREIIGFDWVFKYKGFFATSEHFFRTVDHTNDTIGKFDSNGWYAQAGYLIIPQKWEVAFRYGTWDPTDQRDDNDRNEWRVAGSWYYNKHNLKIQGDFGQIEDEATSSKLNEFRTQVQFIF